MLIVFSVLLIKSLITKVEILLLLLKIEFDLFCFHFRFLAHSLLCRQKTRWKINSLKNSYYFHLLFVNTCSDFMLTSLYVIRTQMLSNINMFQFKYSLQSMNL